MMDEENMQKHKMAKVKNAWIDELGVSRHLTSRNSEPDWIPHNISDHLVALN